ncbi:MAG: SigE family RNA polymerase sigma factor [Microthrixaceae bacterium]
MFGGSGADDEFDKFAVAAWPRLRWSAYLLTGDHHLAEDLAQTALARTYGAWGRVRGNDAVAYSRKVLVNLNIDRMRRRRVTEVGDQVLAHEAATERGDAVADRDEVQRLLSRLTDKERRVVVLRHYFDLSELDVAAELEIAPGTVKSTLSRALAKMRVAAAAYETTKG